MPIMEVNGMALAAIIGTTVGTHNYFHSVVLEKTDGSTMPIAQEIFDNLYYRITNFTAALKTDCIDFASNDIMGDLFDQPVWYIELVEDGIIRMECGMEYFYPDTGEEIAINPGSVILRNFEGDYRYMEYNEFVKYYDFAGSEFIE